MGKSSAIYTEKKTIRRSGRILDIQTANGVVVSETQARPTLRSLVEATSCCRWEDYVKNLVLPIRVGQDELPGYSEVRR